MAILFESGILRRLFGNDYSRIDTLPVDVLTSEKEAHRYMVTDKPTEDGDVKTLGTVALPMVVSITGVFNDDHWGSKSWDDKKTQLLTIANKKAPFTVNLSLGTFDRMVFENIDFDRSSSSKGGLLFSAVLRQITHVASRTVPVPSNPKKNSSSVDVGKKQPVPQTAEEATRTQRTLAAYIKDAVFGE